MNQSQVCTSTSRIYVQSGVYDEFIKLFQQIMKEEIVVGNPSAEGTYHGPQVSKAQHDKVLEYIEIGKKEGAKLVAGGSRKGTEGYFVEPTLFIDVQKDMRIINEGTPAESGVLSVTDSSQRSLVLYAALQSLRPKRKSSLWPMTLNTVSLPQCTLKTSGPLTG